MSTSVVAAPARKPLLKFWYAYVAAFYAIWLVLMAVFGLLGDVVRQWPIAIVMVFGSLVAGSTPMGGGAVAFPFLVLVLGVAADSARSFGLVIQALGMTSAMIFILCRRVPIQGLVLLWTIAGAAAGVLIGTFAIAPYLAPNVVKLTFACLWMSFAILTVPKNREFCALVGVRAIGSAAAMRTGLLAGLTGGVIASMIGVGVEMALYTVLVLLYRCDLKVAVPTAVSAMAVTSIVGTAVHAGLGDIPRDVLLKFLAAGPIVVFGAPIGTYIVSVIPRPRTLYFVSSLCVVQFVWTLNRVGPTMAEWAFVACAMLAATVGFYVMYRRGRRNLP